MSATLDYGNWIRSNKLIALGAGAIGAAGLAFLPLGPIPRLALGGLSAILAASVALPLYARWAFSPGGGDLQRRLYGRIADKLGPSFGGRVLDIGAGNGMLAVHIALRHPQAKVIGVDTWSAEWEYALATCERNARIAGVADRVTYQRGDAARLPFEAGVFDVVVSNLTFHEVRHASSCADLVVEALRVLKPGGTFVLIDLFYNARLYGPTNAFTDRLKAAGVTDLVLRPLDAELPIALPLKHPRALGQAGLLTGVKAA